jgi:hypothetical protein
MNSIVHTQMPYFPAYKRRILRHERIDLAAPLLELLCHVSDCRA